MTYWIPTFAGMTNLSRVPGRRPRLWIPDCDLTEEILRCAQNDSYEMAYRKPKYILLRKIPLGVFYKRGPIGANGVAGGVLTECDFSRN
jgi:hypothetical protein